MVYQEKKVRSLVKAFTWRILASATTFLITFVLIYFSSDSIDQGLKMGLQVSIFDFVLKIVLYFFHERIWLAVPFGKSDS